MSVDDVDRQIIDAVTDRPLWKQRIHRDIAADRALNTVCSRVDRLEEDGYLKTCIIAPDDIAPDLIIAFKATAKGRGLVNGGDHDE